MEWSNTIIALLLLLMVTSKDQLAALRHSKGIGRRGRKKKREKEKESSSGFQEGSADQTVISLELSTMESSVST